MDEKRQPYKALYTEIEGNKRRGRPRKTWMDNIKEDINVKGISIIEGRCLTEDRTSWKHFVSNYCH